MDWTIVSGNKRSPVNLNQNHAIVFIKNLEFNVKYNTKSQYTKIQVGWCWGAN